MASVLDKFTVKVGYDLGVLPMHTKQKELHMEGHCGTEA